VSNAILIIYRVSTPPLTFVPREAISINQNWHGHPGRRLNITSLSATKGQNVEVWAKPQANNAWAILVINLDGAASSTPFKIPLGAALGDAVSCGGKSGSSGNDASGKCSVRDVWSHSDAAAISNGAWEVAALSPHDSHFVLISPTA
jgi:hypothetical protein